MGAKGSKEAKAAAELGKTGRGLSKEDLAGCLASLSDMAHTGVGTALPEIRVNDGPPQTMSPHSERNFREQLRARLQRMSSHDDRTFNEQVSRQLQLLEGLDDQEDTRDWASMRGWLVWALHNNLDEPESPGEDDVPGFQPRKGSPSDSTSERRRGNLQRQMSLDTPKKNVLSHQAALSFESDKDGRMSNQNSFDSTNANGET